MPVEAALAMVEEETAVMASEARVEAMVAKPKAEARPVKTMVAKPKAGAGPVKAVPMKVVMSKSRMLSVDS
ncbi:MAG: hypothetical protein L0099_08670 [Acidobacteria bacterium]|nr:hypothetical protein [Acidobacteriota bacterium]